jgi:hypothetical protein
MAMERHGWRGLKEPVLGILQGADGISGRLRKSEGAQGDNNHHVPYM